MSIVIFGDSFTFPEGNAATNRIYTYAKGFVDNNVKVHVICNRNEYLENSNGILEGIYYYNPFNQSKRSNSFFLRNWYKIAKYINTIRIVKKINRDNKIAAIINDTHDILTHMFSYYLAKRVGTKLVVEKSEHPLRLYQGSRLRERQGLIKQKIESRYCDGIICISHFLVKYYKGFGIKEKKLFLMPSTVDTERFVVSAEKPFLFDYIGYFGGLTFSRDHIDVLVKAFVPLSEKNPEIHLVIGGFCTEPERQQLKNLISDLRLSEKVILLEYLPRAEIVKYIVNSHILVMVRAKDLETSASFPSKLTEYLVTSKPVVTVDVGEISYYLQDGLNAFLVEPGDSLKLCEKLDFVLNNYDLALEVAERGKELTNTIFNYKVQAGRMIEYINSLNRQ